MNNQLMFGDKVHIWHAEGDYLFLGYAKPQDVSCCEPCAYVIAEGSRVVECWEVSAIADKWREAA
jgi:hypothetical protein